MCFPREIFHSQIKVIFDCHYNSLHLVLECPIYSHNYYCTCENSFHHVHNNFSNFY